MVWSLLLDALWKPKDLNASRAQEIIQLLQHGADPNFYGNHVTSPWAIVLEYVFQFNRTEYLRANFKDVEFPGAGPAAELVTNMVKHGAAISTIPESDLDHIVEEVWGDFSIKFVRDRVKKAVENFEFRNRPGRNLVTLWW
jgi:hypothetical protein